MLDSTGLLYRVGRGAKSSEMSISRLATSYISHLKRILSDEEGGDSDGVREDEGGAGSGLKRRDAGGVVSLVSNSRLLSLKKSGGFKWAQKVKPVEFLIGGTDQMA